MSKSQTPVGVMESHHKAVLETGADHARRHLFLFGGVDDDLAYRFSAGLSVMDAIDGDITVNLSSYGGYIEDGFAIYDRIKLARNRIVIVGYGPIMSMGSIIMQAGDLRLLAPQSRFLLHDGSAGYEATSNKFVAMGKEVEQTVGRLAQIYVERTGMKPDAIRKLMDAETYLSPAEAVSMGFADGIAMPNKLTPPPIPKKKKRSKR